MANVTPASQSPIEADSHEDQDSGISDNESSYTQSVRSELMQSVRENGRGYHRYRDGIYLLPDDEREQERLDMQHAMFLRTFKNRLYLAPIDQPIGEVLDLGTGTGIWCIDFADEHPEATVTGIDLSPIQPTWVPPNCVFQIDDFEADWTYKKKFDFIHARMMLSSCNDFPRIFQQSFEHLQPAGWFEIQDVSMPACDDGTLEGTAFERWNELFSEACGKMGRDVTWTSRYKEWLGAAGYQNVEERTFKWPINSWAKDPELKLIGRWNEINMSEGLEAFTVRLFSATFGMSMEAIQLFMADVRKDIHNRKIHVYWPM